MMHNIAQALSNRGEIRMPAEMRRRRLTRMGDNNKAAQPFVV
jgi:hypothetical protein